MKLPNVLRDLPDEVLDAGEAAAVARARAERSRIAADRAFDDMVAVAIRMTPGFEQHPPSNRDRRRGRYAEDVPGAVHSLTIDDQGHGLVELSWHTPDYTTPEVTCYRIERRRHRKAEHWVGIWLSLEPWTTIPDQDPGVEFEYRVCAWNGMGNGRFSNVVQAVPSHPTSEQ